MTSETSNAIVKLEMESDSDGDVPLSRLSSVQDSGAPQTAEPAEHTWEVPLMHVDIKCEYEYSPEREDETEPAEQDIQQGGAQTAEQIHPAETSVQQAQSRDATTAPGDRRHQCTICHKYFSGSGVLKKHFRLHTGEKPYACDICERKFTHNSSFRRHLMAHTGQKPYECGICHHRFTQESSLRTHLRIHTAEKPFECNICNKRFARKYHLEEHTRVHTADKPYACNICQTRFTRKFSLRKHLRACVQKLNINVVNLSEILCKSSAT